MEILKRNVIWVQHAFNGNIPRDIKEAVERVGPSKYDVVIMASLHVDQNGVFYFGGTRFDQMWSGFPAALLELKQAWDPAKKLLITIGGGGNYADFDHIGADLDGFIEKFVDLAQTYHLDGLDMDFEGDSNGCYTDKYRDILAGIINGYHSTGGDPIITMSPYEDHGFWAGDAGVLSKTRTKAGNAVRWLNVQFYEGDDNTPPDGWPAKFGDWKNAVAKGPNGISQGEAENFIGPGCNTDCKPLGYCYSPETILEAIGRTRTDYPDMGGAFAWNYDQIGGLNLGAWATAMYDALNKKAPARPQAG